jgi:hypothetical protein
MTFPGQELLEILNKIRKLDTTDEHISFVALVHRLNKSGVERTAGLLYAMGNDCSYYRKSLDIFLRRDYEDLKQIINNQINRDDEVGSLLSRAREIMNKL